MLNIIPQPKRVKYHDNKNKISLMLSEAYLYMELKDNRINDILKRLSSNMKVTTTIEQQNGFCLMLNSSARVHMDNKAYEELRDKPEGYTLKIEGNSICAFSWYVQGLFYGIQTLRQIIENNNEITALEIVDWPDIEKRSMYFDLRQTFPKYENLISYIEDMARFKTNTLIVEYEDKFAFEKYPFLRHKEYAFSNEQLEEIKSVARKNFIDIIPLQQSFGHLEYVLKHDAFKNLRETEEYLGELCPSKPESFELAKDLITEIIKKHSDSDYIHLGCDEVWNLCRCEACNSKYNSSREKTFIAFVNKLVDVVCGMGKKPIIWHDMLAGCSDEDVKLIDQRVAVMIWIYGGKAIKKQVGDLTARFRDNGIEVIGSSAVRCLDGNNNQNYPNVQNRISNINQWVNTAIDTEIKFMVSTNWATAFGMGCPYGIYETSIYLMYYSGEKYWNAHSDATSFLKRFFSVFHGVETKETQSLLENSDVLDYYTIVGTMLPQIEKNKDIAEHIKIMNEYESILTRSKPAGYFIYRYLMFKEEVGELESLQTIAKRYLKKLESIRPKMKDSLSIFLPDSMAALFMNSRFFTHDYMAENFYKELLGNKLDEA